MLDRRSFLASACSLAASPLVTPVAFAALPSDARLVVVILRGAMDGMEALQPYGDPMLRALRPELSVGPEGGALPLTAFHAMHPALSPLAPLWETGELGFAQAVSTPYRGKRSHFDGQDILEAGTAGEVPPMAGRDGWLNRLIGLMPGATGRTALAVGRDDMLVLRGPHPHLSWSPDAELELATATRDLLLHVYHDDPLFRQAATEVLMLSEETMDGERGAGTGPLFRFAAEQLAADARIAALSLGGWDTHRGQHRRMDRVFDRLSRGILALREGLGRDWDRTVVLAMTEFGRTAAQNGTLGTDHGTGGTLIAAGGALNGRRIWGDWPGLSEADLLDRRDLMPTGDVRAYAAWALHGLFGVERAALTTAVFPGLEMGADPRLIL